MQLNLILRILAPLAMVFAGSVSADCPADAPHAKRAAELGPDWAFIDQVYDEREASRLAEVTSRIDALTASGTAGGASTPERIALVVALMDLQATLEWIAAQSTESSTQVPAYEYEYRDAHPHRAKQRRLVRAGLEAHPGDRFLVESMVALQGFDADFHGAQLELAVRSNPTAQHLRETLIMFRLQTGNLEAARPYLVELLRTKPLCEDDPRLDIALEVIAWLHADEHRCPGVKKMLAEHEHRAIETAAINPLNDEAPLFMATAVANALRTRPDAVQPFLASMAHVLSLQMCQ